MRKEIITRETNSFDNKFQTLNTDAPNTFLTPISFLRCSATKDVKPNKPKQEIIIACSVNALESLPTYCIKFFEFVFERLVRVIFLKHAFDFLYRIVSSYCIIQSQYCHVTGVRGNTINYRSCIFVIMDSHSYSVPSLFTGFAIAALMD